MLLNNQPQKRSFLCPSVAFVPAHIEDCSVLSLDYPGA